MRLVTFTHYSVLDVMTTTPVFLFGLLNLLRTIIAGLSSISFKINALSKIYTVKKRKSKKNKKKKYGSMRLTPIQHIRLVTALTLPIGCCCRSAKENTTKLTEEPVKHIINEGGEKLDPNKPQNQTYDTESVDNGADRSSLISNPDGYEEDDDLPMPDLTADQIMRWFKRGSTLFEKETRVEDIMERVLNVEM